ncbi:hypothetical protein NEUTE1DRAFT_115722, partial [Neurospora tetrasperma FGSC 2508]
MVSSSLSFLFRARRSCSSVSPFSLASLSPSALSPETARTASSSSPVANSMLLRTSSS